MQISSYLSKKLCFFSVLGTICVVFIHSRIENVSDPYFINTQNFIIESFCRIFRPLFFSISGFLFFVSDKPWSLSVFSEKVKKRIFTLLIPYLLCNVISYMYWIALSLIPFASRYINTNVMEAFESKNCIEIINFMFYTPAMFHLWFIKTLIIIVLLTPVLFYLLRGKISGIGGLLLLFAGSIFVEIYGIGFPVISLFDVFCFSVGAYFSINNITPSLSLSKIQSIVFLLLSLIFVTAWKNYPALSVFNQCDWLVFIALWCLYDHIYQHVPNKLVAFIAPYTFFIYLFHVPSIQIFKEIFLLLPVSPLNSYIAFILSPILMIFCLCIAGEILSKKAGKLFGILTGGRGTRQ